MRSACFVLFNCVVTVFTAIGSEPPRLLPFQARLTQVDGSALPDGNRTIQFQIFEEPTGGLAMWAGEVHRTTVNGGLVNVLLGSKNALPVDRADNPSRSFFDSTLYLQITPDANGDGVVNHADPPLHPRQAILPALFASDAADSRTSVPVGGVIMWWGKRQAVPAGFELCDGTAPSTPGAKLAGAKPDLQDRFPKGARGEATDVQNSFVAGGSHTIEERLTGDVSLTLAQMPNHPHSVNLNTSSSGAHHHNLAIQQNGNKGIWGLSAGGLSGYSGPHSRATDDQGNHSHSVVGETSSVGAGAPHSHTIPAHDNRPAFLEFFFIIRVK